MQDSTLIWLTGLISLSSVLRAGSSTYDLKQGDLSQLVFKQLSCLIQIATPSRASLLAPAIGAVTNMDWHWISVTSPYERVLIGRCYRNRLPVVRHLGCGMGRKEAVLLVLTVFV